MIIRFLEDLLHWNEEELDMTEISGLSVDCSSTKASEIMKGAKFE